jgi:hypothetical protein
MGAGFRGASNGFNQAMQYDIQLRQAQPMQMYPLNPPQQNNHWQEEWARQQYYDNLRRQQQESTNRINRSLGLPGY